MKKLIIILLSVLAITFTFSGCGGSEGSIKTDGGAVVVTPDKPDPVVDTPDPVEVESFDALGSIQESVGSLPGSPSGVILPGSES